MEIQPALRPARSDRLRRSAERYSSELPVEIGGAYGLTRNVSATGVYFETTAQQTPGSRVQFLLEVLVRGERLKMICAGNVVRVEQKLGTVGIAVKLASSFFADTGSMEDPDDPMDH
jgi:hypothetical protein